MNNVSRYLYTVYRNRDDKLMILDGTAEECAKVMGIDKKTFYVFISRGENSKWTIMKASKKEIAAQSYA